MLASPRGELIQMAALLGRAEVFFTVVIVGFNVGGAWLGVE